MEVAEIQKRIAEINQLMSSSSISAGERMKLQQEKNKLMVSLLPDDSDEEDEEEDRSGKDEVKDDSGRERKFDPRIQFCNNDTDIYGSKLRNYNDLRLVLMDNLNTIYCYTTKEIIHMLNPGAEQLYYWKQHERRSFCCPILEKKVYKLDYVGLFLDHTAEFLNVFKMSRLVFKEKAQIGSNVAGSTAVSAIHGAEHNIYRIVPMDPVKLFPLMKTIRETLFQKIVVDESKYQPLQNSLTELIRIKNNIVSDIELKKDKEREELINNYLQEKFKRDLIESFPTTPTNESDETYINETYDWLRNHPRSIISQSDIYLTDELRDERDFTAVADFLKYTFMYTPYDFTLSDVKEYIKKRKDSGTYNDNVAKIESAIDFKDYKYTTINKELADLENIEKRILEVNTAIEPLKKEIEEKRQVNILSGEKLVKDCELSYSQYFQSVLKTVLEKDKNARYEGVKDDLYTEKDLLIIPKDKDLIKLFDIPYIPGIRRNRNVDIERFIKVYKDCDVLAHVYNYMFGHNIIVAGGYPSAIICNKSILSKDTDIFFYNTPLERANEIILMIESMLDSTFTKFSVSKTTNTITLTYGSASEEYVKLQFILRMYNTKSEILHGFDIGSSAVGFDGKHLLFTSLSKFAYEYGCNVIDTTRRSTTYEQRLLKYMAFDILMPDFDIQKLDTDFKRYNDYFPADDKNELDKDNIIPFEVSFPFNVTIDKIIGNTILAGNKCIGPSLNTESDYLPIMKNELNIRNIVTRQYDKIYISSTGKKQNLKAILTKSWLDEFKGIVKHKVKTRYKEQVSGSRGCTQNSKYRLFSSIYNVLSEPEKLREIVNKEPLDVIYREIDRQYKLALKNIEEIPESVLEIQWMTKNQMTQLTSSLNPIMKDPKDWYGNYYKYNDKFWSLKISD